MELNREMAKETTLKKYQDEIMENGTAHIIYHANSVDDIIHPFSSEGYELLSDDFAEFLDKYRAIIPEKAPIVLDIVGNPLTEDEKQVVDKAIWAHFCLQMRIANAEGRTCLKKSALYLLYTLLSSVLLFLVINETNEIISNLAYIPFWFFGYRLLIFIILDAIPTWKKNSWYRQLASIKVIFGGDKVVPLDADSSEQIAAEVSEFKHEANEELKSDIIYNTYFTWEDVSMIACKVRSLADFVQVPDLKIREFLAAPMATYLSQIEPFLSSDSQVALYIFGEKFDDEEKARVKLAIENYYGFRIAEYDNEQNINKKRIFYFSLFAVISSIVILVWGKAFDVAMHEFIMMLFWFVGDYLLEFILISHKDIKNTKKVLEKCRTMDIYYDADNENN